MELDRRHVFERRVGRREVVGRHDPAFHQGKRVEDQSRVGAGNEGAGQGGQAHHGEGDAGEAAHASVSPVRNCRVTLKDKRETGPHERGMDQEGEG